MTLQPPTAEIMDRLAGHGTLGQAPPSELEWLVAHGQIRRLEAGEAMARAGDRVEDSEMGMEILLDGRLAVWVDRGAGTRKVIEWQGGELAGILPFSRMSVNPGNVVAETPLETLSIHRRHFPELIRECPIVVAQCVHVMLDRARVFNTSAWQDEKMASLGKLAAGLAHELNNPASAVARSGRLLERAMDEADRAARTLALVGLDDERAAAVDRLREACMAESSTVYRSPLDRADREDQIAEWLDAHGLDQSATESLAESAVTLEALDATAQHLSGEALDAALDWVAAGFAVRTLAAENERAGARVSELVAAMKRLTHMDQAPVREPVDIERGLRDTFMVLGHKARSKSASVKIEVAPGLPRVNAVGEELDQVWMNLLDNALDAIDLGGQVSVTAKPEGRWVLVRVIDDGPGIAMEDQSRVFDPFFTTKEPGEGTGLGLEIARSRIRDHGGEIELDSRPGRTEFSVSLPLDEQAAVHPDAS